MTLQEDITRYATGWLAVDALLDRIATGLQEDYVIINRDDLPAVKAFRADPNMYRVDGENVVFTSEENALGWVLKDVAVWQFIKARKFEAAMLERRRDELAQQAISLPYHELRGPMKHLVDQLITAVDEVARLKESE